MKGTESGMRSFSDTRRAEERIVWEDLNDSFSRVQRILDENRVLIGEINQNHESKMPENLTRNVNLIKELNSNIAQVVGLYTDMSTSFVHGMDAQSLPQDTALLKASSNNPPHHKEFKAESAGQKRARPN